MENVEQVDDAIVALGALCKEIGTDDARYFAVEGLVNRYIAVYDNIIMEIVSNVPEKLTIKLVYNGKTITTSQKPRVKSNCASQFNVKANGDNIVICYNSEYCYEQDDNFVEVSFRFGSKYVKEKAFFKMK